MTTSIARQSVVIKCNMQQSIMIGNYEFYYAAGLFGKISGNEFDFEQTPAEMFEKVIQKMNEYKTEDEKEKYLIHITTNYKPSDEKDNQMKELYEWGLNEKSMWQE